MRKVLSLILLMLPLAVFPQSVPSAKRAIRISELTEPARLVRETPLVKDGRPVSTVLHPDTEAGRQAAAVIASAVLELTGCRLPVRPGTPADTQADQTAILVGNVNSNPALTILYARFFTPVDAICPGQGGSLVHTVFDPFGKKVNAVVVGASDDAGLARAADRLVAVIRQQKKGRNLTLPRIFAADYSAGFRARYPFAGAAPAAERLEAGLRDGQKALDEGKHTSVAGELAQAARRYQLNGDAVEAKLFVALWDLYAKSAVDDPSKFGGPWGFDSDFVSMEVVAGWRIVENDPSLTDADRLAVTRSLARWVSEPVVQSCAEAGGHRVLHNHETFPALGTLFAGLYFSEVCPAAEGPEWLKIADAQFRRQAGHFKPQEDCNGYQWLTIGHLFRYAVARHDPTVFDNGNAKKMIDYCIGAMDNLGIQVPYGDTGSWKCWDSEMACLNVYAFVTGDPAAAWTAARKTAVKNYAALYGYCRDTAGETPGNFNGVHRWPLEPQYVQTFPPEKPMPMESLFDKISFREGFDPAGPYLLLDGLSNGGHKHLDGNSLPRLTQFDRIWLADNDYFKIAVKYHNSLMVFRDGQATPIPAYTRFLGSGENERFGFSQTRIDDYSGVDWARTVVWLKRLGAFVVLDRLTAREASDYQFRLLWHGVGEATLSDKGLFLTQKGPSFWIQPAPGTRLELKNDAELGANWKDYPYADPFVRSLNATVYRKLAQGESHLFATVLHGDAGGSAEPWALEHLENQSAVRLNAGSEKMLIALGPIEQPTSYGKFRSDTGLLVLDKDGLSLFSATRADIDGSPLHSSLKPEHAEIAVTDSKSIIDGIRAIQPAVSQGIQAKILAQKLVWEKTIAAARKTPESGSPITRLAAASFDGPGKLMSILVGTAAGTLSALNSDGTGRWDISVPDRINDIASADLDGDGKDEVVIGRQDSKVTVLDPAGKEKWSRALEFYRRPPYVNVVRTGDLDGDGRPEVIAGGENWRFFAFGAEGRPLWNYESVHPSRSGAVADLDGDGKAEVLCGTHYYWMTALNPDGTKRWTYGTFGSNFGPICYDIAVGSFDNDRTRGVVLGGGDGGVHYISSDGKLRLRYDTGDEVRKVLAADLDGDGRDEIIAGSMSRSVYAFDAGGKRLWRFEAGSPVNTLAFVAYGNKRRLLAGTESGDLYGFDPAGKPVSVNALGSPIVDIITVEKGAVVATSDGQVRRVEIKE
ncbi:MAG: hypothetical protein A2W03_06205 [Candidatus Aminicenantes bacterium RBG_16_63_16]|nr:MAG: hypothetical protein A2W03_06205 [Candidatus Aminicenantes bacterium RBG_16_63_16]